MDIGETEPEPIESQFTGAEGPQPVEVTARLLAHIAHRIPGVKKLEKRFEGKDSKAGIGSDFMALIMQLYARNKAQIDNAASGVVQEKLFHKPANSGGVIIDFGEQSPAGSNNNNGGN